MKPLTDLGAVWHSPGADALALAAAMRAARDAEEADLFAAMLGIAGEVA